jgi:ankyrin repeat protein
MFPPPRHDVSSFTFHDLGNGVAIEGIRLDPKRRTDTVKSSAALERIRQATHITIRLSWSGLTGFVGEAYSLIRSESTFEGERRLLSTGRSEKETIREVAVPIEAATAFLHALSEAPFFEGEYLPTFTHTDDYPQIDIELIAGEEKVLFRTKSQGLGHVPWSVRHGGKIYVVADDTPARSLGVFLRHLDSEISSDRRFRLDVGGRTESETEDSGRDELRSAIQSGDVEKVRRLVEGAAEVNSPFAYDDETPLTVAAFNHRIEIARILLDAGAEVNVRTPRGTALGIAARSGNAEMVQTLLAAGADHNLRGEHNPVPLQEAVAGGHVQVVRNLLSGADGEVEGKEFALFFAAAENAVEIIRLLLSDGTNPNALVDSYTGTPFMVAARNGQTEAVEVLLEAGARVDVQASHGATALGMAISNNVDDIVEILVERGADVRRKGESGATPLMRAQGPEVARILLEAGADVNERDDRGRTPLMRIASVRSGRGYTGQRYREGPPADQQGALRVLLEVGADVNAQDNDGRTALILSAGHHIRPDVEIMRFLLEAGAGVHVADKFGRTALFYCATPFDVTRSQPPPASASFPEAVRLLIDAGADPLAPDEEGQTALHIAAIERAESVVEVMLERPGVLERIEPRRELSRIQKREFVLASGSGHLGRLEVFLAEGADPSRDMFGSRTALGEAIQYDQTPAVRRLLEAGADPNLILPRRQGMTALMLAVERGHLDSVRALLEHGADVNLRDDQGSTALEHAKKQGRDELVRLLENAGARP